MLLKIQKDSYVLDVGCGPAIDTIAFSKFIGANGLIVGVDSDRQMIAKANAELKKQGAINEKVQHVVGDVQSLPFKDSAFDRVHAERLFQVLPQSVASEVFSEMHRVLRIGGIVVVEDADWASASVNFSDAALERRLINFFAMQMRPNGFAGRHLIELLAKEFYTGIKAEVMPFVTRNFNETPFGDWLTTEATKTETASKKEMNLWRRELEEKTTQNKFLSHVNMVIVAGRKK